MIKKIFGSLGSRIWFIVTVSVLVLGIVVNVLATTLLYGIFCQVFGGPQAITADGVSQVFIADFDNKEDARKNGEAVNEKILEEGMVLLKNNDKTLPLAKNAKISVFGKNSVDFVYGGSGSAAGSAEFHKGLDESLEAAGFEYNPTLWSFYENDSQSGAGRPGNPDMNSGGAILNVGETPVSSYTDAVKNSYSSYNDAAVIVLSRIGGEGWDLPRVMNSNGTPVDGARAGDDHYLQLDQNETDLIKHVCDNFDKVVVVLNVATTMELGFLDDATHYAYNAGVDACLWIGAPGDTGIMSLGRVLNGTVNPSGHTVDTYARDFKKDPTWQNFGDYLSNNGGYYTNIGDKISSYYYSFVDYEEGIYVGYKYYETRGLIEGDDWYKKQVVYPFGYGLSYTTFDQEIVNKSNLEITKDGQITVKVKVTNTGDVKGKDAVQIYVTPPYTNGGIEKAHKVLVGFAKTKDIEPGASETVDVVIDPYDIASYDYNDANSNGFKGYELETGKYVITAGENAHTAFDSFEAEVKTAIKYEKSTVNDEVTVENRFDDADDQLGQQMSRSDFAGTFPAPRTSAEKVLDADTNAKINSVATNNPNTYTTLPTQNVVPEVDEEGNPINDFRSLVGKDYDDPLWDTFLNQLTIDEMTALFNNGAFKTEAIVRLGKPATTDADGPAGFADFMGGDSTSPIYGVAHYCCEPIMAATFNGDLLEELGKAVGNEALVGNVRGDGMPYSGWYAPGMNLHRSPFGGRAGEYFSEDPFLSGMLGAREINGAMSKGVYTQVKHFAVNEQETTRTGICTWLNEQTLREVYLRPFEKAVKVGGTMGMMSSFNRIGTMWTGGDYRLLTEVLRNEWGFKGMVISDYNTGSQMNSKQMAYAGGDLNLAGPGQSWSPRKSNATDVTIIRQCAKNILYATNNSNVMNTEVLGYNPPAWIIIMIVVDAVLVVGLAAWGFFAIKKALKK